MNEIIQRTDEWKAIRRGRFTASQIHRLMGKKFGNDLSDWTDTAATYIMEVVSQTFTDQDHELSTPAIRWGNDHEPVARAYYEGYYNEQVEEVGFIMWPKNTAAGCSPDGIVIGKNRGIEIKCPYTIKAHMEAFMIENNADFLRLKPDYYYQCMSSMLFTGYPAWDFVSYHPFFKQNQRMTCIEIVADPAAFDMIEQRLNAAVIVRDKLIERILKMS